MPKRKLSTADKNVIRATIKDGLAKGTPVIDLVTSLSAKYKVVPETIRWYVKGVKENRPVRAPGRPKGSGKKAAPAPKRGPGRPKGSGRKAAPAAARGARRPGGNIFLLDAQAAEIVLRAHGRETTVARVVYQDESKLVSSILRTLSTLQR